MDGKKEFRKQQIPKWEKLLCKLFFNAIPRYAEWVKSESIILVLNEIATSDVYNHTFFPRGGGLDLTEACMSNEEGCIELNFQDASHILKPEKLLFQSFPDASLDWSYFRVVTSRLEPSGLYPESSAQYEELVELSPTNYVDQYHWVTGEYNGEELPSHARLISRSFEGDFVIFAKGSLYNQTVSTYDARHEKLGKEGFNQKLLEMIEDSRK